MPATVLSHGDWISEVASNIELLGNYDFEAIYCRVHLEDFAQQHDIKKLLLSLHLYQPRQIELTGAHNSGSPSRESRAFYLSLMEFLIQRDYQVLGNHLFINNSCQLSKLYRQRNLAFTPQGFCSRQINGWLGTGLGAIGYINEQHYQNSRNLEQYQQLLQAGTLPRDTFCATTQLLPHLQAMVQSLLCNGELDGQLIAQLPATQRCAVESVINQATEQLWLEPSNYLWQLTCLGRIYLRQLLNHLLQIATITL